MIEPSERTNGVVADELVKAQADVQATQQANQQRSQHEHQRARERTGKTDAKPARPRPTLAERRERLLDEIALERIQMRDAAHTVLSPLRKIDELKAKVGGSRQWLYPAAPLLALLVFRLRPGWRSLPSLAARGWTVWRLWRRFR